MTDRQTELFTELFKKYGSYIEEYNTKTIYIHAEHPKKIKTTAEIEKRIKQSIEDIKTLEYYIEMLQAYNASLIDRYNFLSCCNYAKVIKLKRERRYNDNKVFYFLYEINRNLDTEQEEILNTIKYTGKERKEAIKAYEKLCKENPNCIYIFDIKKGRFEK